MVSRYALTIAVAVLTSTHASDVADLIQIKAHNFESINKTSLIHLIVAPKAAFMAKEFLAGLFKTTGAMASKAQTTHHAMHVLHAGELAAARFGFAAVCGTLVGSIIGTVFANTEELVSTAVAYKQELEDKGASMGLDLQVGRDYEPIQLNGLWVPAPESYYRNIIWDEHFGGLRERTVGNLKETFIDQVKEAVDTPTADSMTNDAVSMLGGLGIDSLAPVLFPKLSGEKRDDAAESLNGEFNEGLLVARLMANTIDCCFFNLFPHEKCAGEAYDILKDFAKDKGGEVVCGAAMKMIGLG